MVLKESVFIVNVLCSLVPCDIKYPYPDTSKDTHDLKQHFKIEYNGPIKMVDPLNFYLGHPIVWTHTGKIEGYYMKVVTGRKIFAFEGIPYAEPPLGEHRFRPPLPKQPWQGLYQANEKGPDCIQYNMIKLKRLFGEENCLFLNVYTPYIPNQELNITNIPVLVWFHDGGFLQGSGSDVGPSYLLQNDVILVTINYRLGVLGFMSTGDSASPGNYGLKDQLLALQWVNQNIGAFSGDPSRVTLIGHGSGGSNVHLQMISPRARGLFSSAISLSGTAFNYWSLHSTDEARNLTHYYGKMINCPVHNGSQVLVHCLRQQDALDLVEYQIPLLDDWFAPIILFRPTLEHDYQIDEAFLTETPEEAYNKGNVANVPFMVSFTADEGLTYLLLHAVVGSIKMLRQNWNELAPDFLDYEQFNVDILEITRRITWFYLKDVNAEKAPLGRFADMIRDRFILGGVHKAIQAHCQIAPTYSYVFAYNGKYNLGTSVGYKPQEWGVGHGEDVYYIMNSTVKYNGFKKSDPELILSKIMVNLISNFAHRGEPTFTTDQGENIRIWNPITDPKNISTLLIDKVIKMIPEPFLKNIHFWESLGLPDSLPLNFGNANPAVRNYNFGNGLLTNGLPMPGGITQIQAPILSNKSPDINTQISAPINNGYNFNIDQAKLPPINDFVSNGDPQYVGEKAPDKNSLNIFTYDNGDGKSAIPNALNDNRNTQLSANPENFQYQGANANLEKPQEIVSNVPYAKNDNAYDYLDPNAPASEGREVNNLENNNNLGTANLFQNGNTQNSKVDGPQTVNNEGGSPGGNNNDYYNDPNANNGEQNNFNQNLALNRDVPSTNINDEVPPPLVENTNYYSSDPNSEIKEQRSVNGEGQNNIDSLSINAELGDRLASTTPKPEIAANLGNEEPSYEEDDGKIENANGEIDSGVPVVENQVGQEDLEKGSSNLQVKKDNLEKSNSTNSTTDGDGIQEEEYDESNLSDVTIKK